MKRDEIIVLAALFIPITLGTIVWATMPLVPYLIMFAMEPAGTGCDEGPSSDGSSANTRGDVVAEYVKACTEIGTFVDYSITLQLHGAEKATTLVENDDPRSGYPKFHWIDDDTLMIDLGKVRWVTQKTGKVGSIHITYAYSKGE